MGSGATRLVALLALYASLIVAAVASFAVPTPTDRSTQGKGFTLNYLFDVMAYIVKWRVDGANGVTFMNKLIKSVNAPPLFRKCVPHPTYATDSAPRGRRLLRRARYTSREG